MHRPGTIAPLVEKAPAELRDYIGRLERAVALDDPAANRVGASHAFDPQTSRDAAQINFPRSGNQRYRVLVALAARGERGATFEELIADTGIKSAAKRLTELKAGAWAWATGHTRPTSMGAPAEVHRVTARALARLELERRDETKTAGEGAGAALRSDRLAESSGVDHEGDLRADPPSPADPSLVGFDAAIEVGGTESKVPSAFDPFRESEAA